jgi:hypothetical protein
MTNHPKGPEQQSRERRLSAALRENLRRRKAQAKARAVNATEQAPEAEDLAHNEDLAHDSAGISADKDPGE